jgi:hypothetical protein
VDLGALHGDRGWVTMDRALPWRAGAWSAWGGGGEWIGGESVGLGGGVGRGRWRSHVVKLWTPTILAYRVVEIYNFYCPSILNIRLF